MLDKIIARPSADGVFLTLSALAHEANSLAKQLTGPQRSLAYRMKAAACSSLILGGMATVSGMRSNSILCLELLGGRSRLHVPLAHLLPEARTVARHQASCAPVVGPLSERLQ
jgi:hypothetical protein